MYVFYFNLPWLISDEDYNCNSRSLFEWQSRGSVNNVQGVYFATMGVFFLVLYLLCLLGMLRGHFLKHPCYRLMFFNGIIDIAVLVVNSLVPSYFHFLSIADGAMSDQGGNRQHAGGAPIAGGTVAASSEGPTQRGAEGYTGKPSGGKQVAGDVIDCSSGGARQKGAEGYVSSSGVRAKPRAPGNATLSSSEEDDKTGAVFCSTIVFSWIVGHVAWALWCAATVNCLVLAFNRVAEIVPSFRRFHFLFEGKLVYLWMILSLACMAIQPFLTRPLLFNTALSAYLFAPVISDDEEWEGSHYMLLIISMYNITVLVVIAVLYSILCGYVMWFSRLTGAGIDKVQIQLFIQALLICLTTALTTMFYVVLTLVPVPRDIYIVTSVVWQLNHGRCLRVLVVHQRMGGLQCRKESFKVQHCKVYPICGRCSGGVHYEGFMALSTFASTTVYAKKY